MHRNTSIKNNKQTNNNATCSNDSSMPAIATTINRIIRLFHSSHLSFTLLKQCHCDTLHENFLSVCCSRIVIRTTNHWIISPFQSIFLFIYTKFFGGFHAIRALLLTMFSEKMFSPFAWCVLVFCFYFILCKSVLYQEVDPFVIYILLFRLYHCQYFRLVSAFHYLCNTTMQILAKRIATN